MIEAIRFSHGISSWSSTGDRACVTISIPGSSTINSNIMLPLTKTPI